MTNQNIFWDKNVVNFFDKDREVPPKVLDKFSEKLIEFLVNNFSNAEEIRILKPGIGQGRISIPLCKQANLKNIKIFGFDNSPRMLNKLKERKTKEKTANLCYEKIDIEKINLSESYVSNFHAVVIVSFLYHLKDWMTALDKIIRVLQPGGVIVLATLEHSFWTLLVSGRIKEAENLLSNTEDSNCKFLLQLYEKFYELREKYLPPDYSKHGVFTPEPMDVSNFDDAKLYLKSRGLREEEFDLSDLKYSRKLSLEEIKDQFKRGAYSTFRRGIDYNNLKLEITSWIEEQTKNQTIPTSFEIPSGAKISILRLSDKPEDKQFFSELIPQSLIFKWLSSANFKNAVDNLVKEGELGGLTEKGLRERLYLEKKVDRFFPYISNVLLSNGAFGNNFIYGVLNYYSYYLEKWLKPGFPFPMSINTPYTIFLLEWYKEFKFRHSDLIYEGLQGWKRIKYQKINNEKFKTYSENIGECIKNDEILIPVPENLFPNIENMKDEIKNSLKNEETPQDIIKLLNKKMESLLESESNPKKFVEIFRNKWFAKLQKEEIAYSDFKLEDDQEILKSFLFLFLYSPWKICYYFPGMLSKKTPAGGLVIYLRENIEPERIVFLQSVVNRIFSLPGVTEAEARVLKESLKSAIAAIMSRNGSHNIGSHIISAASSNINDYSDTQMLLKYIQQRMDFIATITTEFPNWSYPVWFTKDLMRRFYEQRLVLEYIAESEGVRAYEFQPKNKDEKQEHKLLIRIKILRNGENEPEEIIGINELITTYKERLKNDLQLAIPGGIIGHQAFYTILENIIRNSAKHGWSKSENKNGNNLEITIQINECEDKDYHIVEIWDNVSSYSCKDGDFEKFDKLYELKNGKLIEESDDDFRTLPLHKKMNHKLMKSFIDQSGKLLKDNWGLAEIKICAGFLNKKSVSKIGASGIKVLFEDKKKNPNKKDGFISAYAHFNLFKISDILEWENFINRIKDEKETEPVQKKIWTLLDNKSKNIINNFTDDSKLEDEDKTTIIKALNSILKENNFYKNTLFTEIIKNEEFNPFINGEYQDIIKSQLINRILFEYIYENEIQKNSKFTLGYKFPILKPKEVLIINYPDSDIRDEDKKEAKKNSVYYSKNNSDFDYEFVVLYDDEKNELINKIHDYIRSSKDNEDRNKILDSIKSEIERYPYRLFIVSDEIKKKNLSGFLGKRIVIIKKEEFTNQTNNWEEFKLWLYSKWIEHLSVIRGIEDKELKLLINLAGNSGEGQSGEKIAETVFDKFNSNILELLKTFNLCDKKLHEKLEKIQWQDLAEWDKIRERNLWGEEGSNFNDVKAFTMAWYKLALFYARTDNNIDLFDRLIKNNMIKNIKISKDSLTNLKVENLEENILTKLNNLKNRKYNDVNEFKSDLQKKSEKYEENSDYKLILKYADFEINNDEWDRNYIMSDKSILESITEQFWIITKQNFMKYEEKIETLPKTLTANGEKNNNNWNIKHLKNIIIEKEDNKKVDISYNRHFLKKDAEIYSEAISGSQIYFNILSHLDDNEYLKSKIVMQLLENAFSRVLIIDERVAQFYQKSKELQTEYKNAKITIPYSVSDKETDNELKLISSNIKDSGKITLSKIEEGKYDIIIIHQGVLEKLYGSNKDIIGNQINSLKDKIPFVLITSGRGTPSTLPEDAKLLAFSNIESFLLKNYHEKFLLTQIIMKINRSIK